MSKTFYAIFSPDSYELFDNLEFAVKMKPQFIFSYESKGICVTKYPERTDESEHFNIEYYNSNGNCTDIEAGGWKAYDIQDPMRYGRVLSLKIRDPQGRIRIFDIQNNRDAHYTNTFFNFISSLIELVDVVKALEQFKNWPTVEEAYEKDYSNIPEVLKIKLG